MEKKRVIKKKPVLTAAQKADKRAKNAAISAQAKELGMTIKEYRTYIKVLKEEAKLAKESMPKVKSVEELKDDIEYNKAVKEEIRARDTRYTFDTVEDILELPMGESGFPDKTIRYLMVVDTTPVGNAMVRKLYAMLAGAKAEKLLFRQGEYAVHVGGNTKFKFICTSKLSKVPAEVNHYDKVLYHVNVSETFKV